MTDVKVRDLRQNLPAYLARAQRGEKLRVTSRGKAIAEIGPPAPPPRGKPGRACAQGQRAQMG